MMIGRQFGSETEQSMSSDAERGALSEGSATDGHTQESYHTKPLVSPASAAMFRTSVDPTTHDNAPTGADILEAALQSQQSATPPGLAPTQPGVATPIAATPQQH